MKREEEKRRKYVGLREKRGREGCIRFGLKDEGYKRQIFFFFEGDKKRTNKARKRKEGGITGKHEGREAKIMKGRETGKGRGNMQKKKKICR